jgi:hypothetical protein
LAAPAVHRCASVAETWLNFLQGKQERRLIRRKEVRRMKPTASNSRTIATTLNGIVPLGHSGAPLAGPTSTSRRAGSDTVAISNKITPDAGTKDTGQVRLGDSAPAF